MRRHLTVHQFHYSVSAADAVTNQMRWIQKALRSRGIDGNLYACETKNLSPDLVKNFSPNQLWNCDLLLIHHSHGNPKLKEVLKVEVPKALVYHNITPEAFFRHDTYIGELCREGRQQLETLRGSVFKCFADSQYNADELIALGFPSPELLPLFDLTLPDKKISTKRANHRLFQLLFVGKLCAHKNQAALIETVFTLRESFKKEVELVLVGGEDPTYGRYLKWLAISLGVEKWVKFTGKISDRALKKAYETSDLFLSASQHEGFCIPLVEAMAAGLPVAALARAAVPETLGDGGVLYHSDRAMEMAALVAALIDKPILLSQMALAAKKRAATISAEQSEANLISRLEDALSLARLPPSQRINDSPISEKFLTT